MFLFFDCVFCSTKGLEEVIFSANSQSLFTQSFSFIFRLFVIFMTFRSQDSRNDIYEESHYKLRLPPFEEKKTKNPPSLAKTSAGIRVWLITYKCLLANLRPLLTQQKRIWGLNHHNHIWVRGFSFFFRWEIVWNGRVSSCWACQ